MLHFASQIVTFLVVTLCVCFYILQRNMNSRLGSRHKLSSAKIPCPRLSVGGDDRKLKSWAGDERGLVSTGSRSSLIPLFAHPRFPEIVPTDPEPGKATTKTNDLSGLLKFTLVLSHLNLT